MSSERSVVGVDLGGTQIRAARLDPTHPTLQDRIGVLTLADEGPECVFERIVSAIEHAASEVGVRRLDAIGIGVPGPCDPRAGMVYEMPNIPGWNDVPLQLMLEERLHVPVRLGNDANLGALGEHAFGGGQGVDDLIYITVSTGIGGGVIAGGQLLLGHHGLAGEIGHVVVDPNGPVCNCGGVGHIEALASGTAIARTARARVAAEQPTLLRSLVNGQLDQITARHVNEAAQKGDPLSRAVLREAGHYLGLAFINFIHIFNPQLILMGGGVANCGEIIMEPIWETIREGVMNPAYLRHLRIERAALGGDVGLWGAVALATHT